MTTLHTAAAPAQGLSREVVGAGLVFALSAGFVGAAGALPGDASRVMLIAGWPAFALAGGVLGDRSTDPVVGRLGRVLVALALVAPATILWAIMRARGLPSAATLEAAVAQLAGAQVVALGFGVSWAARPPSRRTARVPFVVALVGALLVVVPSTRPAGWAVLGAGWAVHLTTALLASPTGRQRRRRDTWMLGSLTTVGVVVALAWWWLPRYLANDVTGFGLWALAIVLTRLATTGEFRPYRELAVDLLVGLAALGAALLVAVLVHVGATLTHLQSPTTFAAFGALVTAAFAVPVGLRVRRSVLARHYGTGALAPADVADLTADLHARTEPRELLERAARMVATASGSAAVRIVLDDEASALPPRWVEYPLVVGGDRVGGLLVESAHAEGPELRQRRVVEQLLPTVALVARAVGLAVEAEHARRDVARERDAERARILRDLHDGLGPVLAGLSMRVRAGLRSEPTTYEGLLRGVADDLAASRADLRRIVAGITPSVLDDGDLAAALASLVRSFGDGDGPAVSLDVRLAGPVAQELQVTVYRCVAEGITNALRHAQPHRIGVAVCSDHAHLRADVVDDGTGGAVVPGVGLTSLRHRAEAVGGSLTVTRRESGGTGLRVVLPLHRAAR